MTDDQEMIKLKEIYDELWRDARTMIKDMKRSITMYFFVGLLILALASLYVWYAIIGIASISAGVTGYLVYFTATFGVIGTVLLVVVGMLFLRLYFRMRKKYAKLMGAGKELEA